MIAKASAPVTRRAVPRTSLVSSITASSPPIARGRDPAARPAPRGSSAGKAARSRTATAVLVPCACAWLSAVATLCRVWATAPLAAEATMTCGVPELTSIAPYTSRSRINHSAAAVSATTVISKPSGRRRPRAVRTCSTAVAGPATAIGTPWTDERTDGQAKAVSSTEMIAVSRTTAVATVGQGDGGVSATRGASAAMSTPRRERSRALVRGDKAAEPLGASADERTFAQGAPRFGDIVITARRLKDYVSVSGVSDATRVSFSGLRT